MKVDKDMKENSKMIIFMAKESTTTMMEIAMKEHGKMTSEMEKESSIIRGVE